jgi:hypothetical protein
MWAQFDASLGIEVSLGYQSKESQHKHLAKDFSGCCGTAGEPYLSVGSHADTCRGSGEPAAE